MKLDAILDQIDLGNYALPVFQRGYVWNRDQVRKLMNSLYRGYPIGSLLVWVTPTNTDEIKGNQEVSKGIVHLILDGQQRITSLYGIIRGLTPPFFEGDEKAFKDLFFNVKDEVFEFYQAAKMLNNPDWISVTEIMKKGAGKFVQEKNEHIQNLDKLNTIVNVRSVDLPIQEVSGEDKTIDVVVDIFNNVNSGGTKLSKGDLALAKLCAEWPEARVELNSILNWLRGNGFFFSMDWLLRCVTVYLTGQPYFTGLDEVGISEFQKSLPATKDLIGSILDQVGSRLGLDHDRVVSGVFAFPVVIQLIKQTKKADRTHAFWNKILYWYIHTFIWGRYSGSTESVLAKDLNVVNSGQGVEGLISLLRKDRGDLTIRPEDFIAWSTGSRFYPLLYMMTRTGHSIDWLTGVELTNNLLGRSSRLEIHHIFPKQILYEMGYERPEVNSLANYSFLTKETNIIISNKNPLVYFPEVMVGQPNALQTHWVPDNRDLWNPTNYLEFLNQRRILLAEAANKLLNNLYVSSEPAKTEVHWEEVESTNLPLPVPYQDIEEDDLILNVAAWMSNKGFPEGELDYQLVDDTGSILATLDLAWPNGVQTGLSEPVALLLNESVDVLRKASSAGYKYFTEAEEFVSYVSQNFI